MIVLENVVKEYPNGVGAINGISLHIERGEFVFVVGDSGSGKSTLIKLLLKELEPTSGTIRVNGVNLGRMKKRAIPKYRRKIGCVLQQKHTCKHDSQDTACCHLDRCVSHKFLQACLPEFIHFVIFLKCFHKSFCPQKVNHLIEDFSLLSSLHPNPHSIMHDDDRQHG